jgi:uncharacterized paraquat-inducible protein A
VKILKEKLYRYIIIIMLTPEEQKNRKKIKNAKYYLQNKEKILQHLGEKIECEYCKKMITKPHIEKHQQTGKCQKCRIAVV